MDEKPELVVEEEVRYYRSLIENASEFILVADAEGTIQYASSPVERLLGHDLKAADGPSVLDLIHPDDAPVAVDQFTQLLQTPSSSIHIEARVRHKDGSWVVLEGSASNLLDDPSVSGLVVNLHDITRRRRMEEEIKRRNERLAALNAVSAAAVSSLELDKVLRQILERTCQTLNAAAGSILLREPGTGELFFAMGLLDDGTHTMRHRVAPGKGIAGWVVQHGQPALVDDVRRDPRWYPGVDAATGFETHSLLCAPLRHREHIAGVIEIINKREGEFNEEDLSLLVAMASIAAAALENTRLYAASQARVRELTLLNEIGLTLTSTLDRAEVARAALSLIQRLFPTDGIFLLQPDPQTGGLCFVQAMTKAGPLELPLSLSPGEGTASWAIEQRQAILVNHVQDDPRFSDCLDRHLGTETHALMAAPLLVPEGVIGVLEVVSWKTVLYTQDDLRTLQSVASTLAVALENARLYSEQRRLLQEKEQAQQQLIHSEKMSALGRLAASVAHEINNPLQAIQGCLTLTEEELAGSQRREKLTRYLGVVGTEIERIATIVRRMRGFYRPAREGLVPTDVHAILTSVLELASKQLQQSDITVERRWAAGLPQVQANPDHLKQVFLNLALNAIDAMPQGGTLRISSSTAQIQHNGGPPQPAVRIQFKDNGVGMSPEVQSRLFEPFFTTKEHGSGLGLSVSYGIIQAHNGRIIAESQQGVGTTFTTLLPTISPSRPGEEQS